MSDKKMHIAGRLGYRPTWVEIDLGALEYNFKQVRKAISPNTKIMACVKADAYGHGIVPVSKKLVSLGVDYLGVASIDEAISLRREKITSSILILGMVLPSDTDPIFKYGLTQTVCSYELASALSRKAMHYNRPVKIHIKVDTGMGRLGVPYKETFEFIKKVARLKLLSIEGIFTHFPSADYDNSLTRTQIYIFNNLIKQLKKAGIHIVLQHAANSMGVLNYYSSHFNLVRPGIMIYGLHPREGLEIRLKPVLSLKTRIVFLKRMAKGEGVSYGHSYHTKSDTTVVTLPIGYGDGYPRILSNKADVLLKERRFKISGKICMDYILVDVGNTAMKIGEEAVLIGSDGKERITAEELANLSETIPYEIVCGIGSRVPRVYLD